MVDWNKIHGNLPQTVLICQTTDTRLRGEDRDVLGTIKLTVKDLRRILIHGKHVPFLTPEEGETGGVGHWETRVWESCDIVTGLHLPGTDEDTEDQGLSRRLGWCPMKNEWVTPWTGGGNSAIGRDDKGGGNGRWESPSTPLQWTDPEPLLTVPGTPQVGKNFFLDEVGPVRGFVSVALVSLTWKDRVGRFEVKLTQGLSVSLQSQYSWTIPSGAWTHRRAHFKGEPEELIKLFHNGRLRQEGLERAGHRSPTWTVLRSLQKVYGAKRIRGCTIIDAPPSFESAGSEKLPEAEGTDKGLEGSSPTQDEGGATVYWGDDQGPVVMVWDGMLPGEQEKAKTIISDEKDWII